MMAYKSFRSEEEQISSLLDDNTVNYPLLTSEDPVIFHNADYERELLMAYDLDFGESCSTADDEKKPFHFDDMKFEPTFQTSSPSESEAAAEPDVKVPPPPYRFNPYSSGPLIKLPSGPKRGRPAEKKSDTKMANYARNYREQKKNQLAEAQMRVKELEEELALAREENRQLVNALSISNGEISQLRKVIDQDSQIAGVVSRMSNGIASPISMGTSGAGVCLHVGTSGTTVEVCKQCADNSQVRMQSKAKMDDIDNLDFLGDFTALDQYLHS